MRSFILIAMRRQTETQPCVLHSKLDTCWESWVSCDVPFEPEHHVVEIKPFLCAWHLGQDVIPSCPVTPQGYTKGVHEGSTSYGISAGMSRVPSYSITSHHVPPHGGRIQPLCACKRAPPPPWTSHSQLPCALLLVLCVNEQSDFLYPRYPTFLRKEMLP